MSAHDEKLIGLELIELANALDSVRILADCERAGCLPTASELRQVCRATSATVHLIGERLRQLGADLASDAAAGPEEAIDEEDEPAVSRAAAAVSAAVRRRRAGGRRDAAATPARSRVRRPARPGRRR